MCCVVYHNELINEVMHYATGCWLGVDADILSEQSETPDRGWSSSLGMSRWGTGSHYSLVSIVTRLPDG